MISEEDFSRRADRFLKKWADKWKQWETEEEKLIRELRLERERNLNLELRIEKKEEQEKDQ